MEARFLVYRVKIHNVLNCCHFRTSELNVKLMNNKNEEKGTLCGSVSQYNSKKGAAVTCLTPTEGRFVVIGMFGINVTMVVCQVSVYAFGEYT